MLKNLTGPDTPVATILFSWMGIAAAAVLAVLGVMLFIKISNKKGKSIFLMAIAAFSALFFIRTLTSVNFFACCWSDTSTILLYLGIFLPQLYFIWDGCRTLRHRAKDS